MIENDRVYEILTEICDTVKTKRNNGFICRCPVCGDSSKSDRISRLHVDLYQKYNDWIARCYNGGCPISGSTNLISLYSTVKGITYSQSKKIINDGVYDIDKLKAKLSPKKEHIEEEFINKPIHLSDKYLSVDSIPNDKYQERYLDQLNKFIKDRYIPDEYICYIAISGKYKGRIIIPIYSNDRIMYFQGRSLFDNVTPKYLNPDIDKTGVILNDNLFDKEKYIILTEGIIDAWMVDNHQGTSCLGAYFSDTLIKKLIKKTNKGVIVCFDNPLIDKAGYDELIKFTKESIYKNNIKYFLPDTKTSKI